MKLQIAFKRPGWTYMPYLYFIGLAGFWFFGELFEGKNFSYLALLTMVILFAQAIIQSKIFGISLGVFVMALSFMAFLAVISEFNDFQTTSVSAIQLVTVGSILSLTGLAMGFLLTSTNATRVNSK